MNLEKTSLEKIGISEIRDKLTICFPKNLNLEESEDLLEYLAKELGANVEYNAFYHKSVTHTKEGVRTFKGPLKLNGLIYLLNNEEKRDYFAIMHSDFDQEICEMGQLEFYMASGCDVDEYEEEARELWDDVRKAVGKYFKSRS